MPPEQDGAPLSRHLRMDGEERLGELRVFRAAVSAVSGEEGSGREEVRKEDVYEKEGYGEGSLAGGNRGRDL